MGRWSKCDKRASGSMRWLFGAAVCLVLGAGACNTDVWDNTADSGKTQKDIGADNHVIPDSYKPKHTLISISVTPVNAIVEVDLNKPTSRPYKATGYFADGKEEDYTAKVTWSHNNPKVGTFSGGDLQIPGMTKTGAEVTLITATFKDKTARSQLTVVSYRRTGPKTDFFFILPYKDKTGKKSKPLDFSTDVQALDVFFNMDCTGSMGGEIGNLKTGLKSSVVPGIQAQIPGTQFGAGAFMDFPIKPFGTAGRDQPFQLFQTITANVGDVQKAVDGYTRPGTSSPICSGADLAESTIEALYQIATGQGLTGPAPTSVPPNHVGIGGVGFRKGSMPVVVHITDALTHAPGESTGACGSQYAVDYANASIKAVAHTRAQAKAELLKICARVVGIGSILSARPQCSGVVDLEDFARATGALVPPETWDVPARPNNCPKGQCCTGVNGAGQPAGPSGLCPLVFKVDDRGTGLSSSVVTGIKMLARYAPFDVKTQTVGESKDQAGVALPTGRTTAHFIKLVAPHSFKKPPPPPTLPDPVKGGGGFQQVTPGTTVTFTVEAFNDIVEATSKARIFRAVIKVLAGGCTDLDQREVFILVPPKAIIK